MAPLPEPATGTQPATAMVLDEPGRPAAEEVKLVTPPAISVVPAPEPAAGHPTPPAAEAGMAPEPVPATETQPATAGAAPQPALETWYPSAVPAAPASATAAEADMSVRQPAPPSSPPPAVEANVPARQPAPSAPAARPRYPANGYGYYQPPSSWQPYYQPGYQPAPARR